MRDRHDAPLFWSSILSDSIFNDSALIPPPTSFKTGASGQSKNSNQTVSASAAGMRAIVYQLQALYLRTPVKLFRPSRFDYLAYVRELADKHDNIKLKPYKFRTHSSVGMLISVLRKEGWRFIPDQVLPPLIANSATGLILYATYLSALDKVGFNSYLNVWKAGLIAGAAQSLAAAPVDAIYTRLSAAEMLNGNHQNLWVYGLKKLKEIGLVGVFAGYGFSLIKESLGFAFYFSTFELVKTKGYNLTYKMIRSYRLIKSSFRKKLAFIMNKPPLIDEKLMKLAETKLTKILKSSFILLAGASAALTLITVQYPLSKVQKVHLSRLEALDVYNAYHETSRPFVKLYYNSYIDTYHHIMKMKAKSKLPWFQFAYKGFVRNALTTIPATSIGLLVFEIMRTKLADSMDEEYLK